MSDDDLAYPADAMRAATDRIRELESEVERLGALVNGDHKLSRFYVEQRKQAGRDKGVATGVEATGPLMVAFAAEARSMLDDPAAANFIELQFEDDLGELALVIQRSEGETPATKATRLQRELDEARLHHDTAMATLRDSANRIADERDRLQGALDRANALIGDQADEMSRLQRELDEARAR